MVWKILFKNFPQFIVIHIVNEAEVDVFLEFSFSMIQQMLAVSSLIALPFLNQLVHPEVLGSHTVEA